MAAYQGFDLQKLEVKVISLNISGLRKKTKFVKHIIIKYKPDILCLQETNINDDYNRNKSIFELGADKNSSFFNYPNNKSNGTAIFCFSKTIKCNNVLFYDEGRTIFLDLSQNFIKFTLINVYAPAISTQRHLFFDSLLSKIENHSFNNNLILAGDFNITVEDIDITGTKGTNRIGRPELRNIIETFKLKDAFRALYPTKIETTFQNKTISRAARLDRIYVSDHLPLANTTHIVSTLDFTDHKAIIASVSNMCHNSSSNDKYAHWKFNDSLLENEDFVNAVRETITANCNNSNEYSIIDKYDTLNSIFKNIAIKYSCRIEKKRNARLKLLNSIIKAMEEKRNNNLNEQLCLLKEERDDILNHKYRGAVIRSKLPIYQEKPTKVFLSLESSIQNSRIITEINDLNGETVTDSNKIPLVFKDFYKNLYSYQNTDNLVQDHYLNYTRKLSNEQRDVINQPLTLTDLKNALWDMREDGSPGPNGLTVRFFKFFFNELSPIFIKLVDSCFRTSEVSEAFKLSYTILLPKDSGSPLEIKNYRPISLLNISFKIITKALANRIAPFLEDIIHPDQAAVIKGRSIQSHNHMIRDLISLANVRGDNAVILSIDQQKAFDRVSHEWMFKVLKQCNVGDNFLRWVKILNTGATSKILINKTLTTKYKLLRGVRQGDVLSPILYIMTLEPLLEKVRQDISITGLHIPNKGLQKLLAFADDTNFFVNNKESITKIISTFEHFGGASGSLININKTKLMEIGEGLDFDDENLIERVNEIKLLGIFYVNAINQTSPRNWDHLITQIESKVNKIYYKQASIFGRSILVNTFIEPKLVYPSMTLNPPAEIIKLFKKIIRAFIFKGTLPCIRHNTIIQRKEDGGTNLHDIELKIKSFRLKYLYKVLESQDEYPLPCYFLSNSLTNIFKQNTYEFYDGELPSFYESIKDIYLCHSNLFHLSNSVSIYYNLIHMKKQILNDQIKRAN